jgi:hypothetical protein
MCGSLASRALPLALRLAATAQLLLAEARAAAVAKRTAGGSSGATQRSCRSCSTVASSRPSRWGLTGAQGVDRHAAGA